MLFACDVPRIRREKRGCFALGLDVIYFHQLSSVEVVAGEETSTKIRIVASSICVRGIQNCVLDALQLRLGCHMTETMKLKVSINDSQKV